MTLSELILGVLTFGIPVCLIVVSARRWQGAVSVFGRAAEITGGGITERIYRKRVLEIAATIRDVRVAARWVGVRLNLTTVWAECPGTNGIDILVRLRREAPVTGGALRDAFEVVTNDEARSRKWLRDKTINAMLKAKGYRFRVINGRAEAVRSGVESTPDNLVVAMRAVALLSKGG